MNQKARHWIKYLMGTLYIPRRPFRPPIWLFSTRRSGSTLLMELLYSQRHINYSAQPLDFWHYHPYRESLPQPYLHRFISLESDEERTLHAFFRQLLDGRIRVRSQWNLLDSSYSFIVDRLVVKVLNAKPLIDWFAERFEGQMVYLVRHPIPAALSVLRRGWGCTAEAFLANDYFCRTYLDEARIKECRRILKHGSALERHVLEWGLDNMVPLSVFRNRSWLTLTYEELIARPVPMCRLLATWLDLSEPDRMIERMSRPTKTTDARSKADITERNSAFLLRRWESEVDLEVAHELMRMLEELCRINVYAADSAFPTSALCHFGSFDREKLI
jgi:hypothetical protein